MRLAIFLGTEKVVSELLDMRAPTASRRGDVVLLEVDIRLLLAHQYYLDITSDDIENALRNGRAPNEILGEYGYVLTFDDMPTNSFIVVDEHRMANFWSEVDRRL